MNSAERTELEGLRRYFQACENAFGKQHWNADAILDHFNEDGSLKGEGKWRGKEIHDWLLKWQAAQDELNAVEFSGESHAVERAEVERDAERYRWLRDRINWRDEEDRVGTYRAWTHCDYRREKPSSESIDEYIDAALQRESKP